MAEKVTAAVKVGPGQTQVREFNLPQIGPDAGFLKVMAAGVCGSDVRSYPRVREHGSPNIMGHENVGYIARLGPEAAQRWALKEGDRVLLEEYLPCQDCEWCRSGEYRLCKTADSTRPGVLRYGMTPLDVPPALWGGFSQYMYLHPNSVFHPLPDHVPSEHAAAGIPMGNGVQWAQIEGGAGPGKTIVIQGPGQQGLGCTIAAKEAGADCIIVTGLSRDTRRLEVARHCGADHTIDVEEEDLRQRVAEITGGRGADIVVDVTGGSAATVLAGIDILKDKGGVLVLQGGEVPDFPLGRVTRKYITIKSCRGHSYAAVERAIQLIASGKYPFNEICSHRFGLEEVDTAIRATGGEVVPGAIHVSVMPWG